MLPYAHNQKHTHPLRPRSRPNTHMMLRLKRNPVIYLLIAAVGLYLLYSVTTGNDFDMPFRTSTESRLRQAADRKTDSLNFQKTTPEEIAHSMKDQGGHAILPDVEKAQLIKDLGSDKQTASDSGLATSPVLDAEVEEQSVAGRKTMPKPKEKPKYPVTAEDKSKFSIGEEPALNGGKLEKVADPATIEAKAELDDILKRSPIIIFSKSRCPYSARAKHLLLRTYSITPAPYVVELDLLSSPLKLSADPDADTVPMGRKIQDLLAEWTGRRTVPNILVNARSIGGSDDIANMEAEDKLVDEIKRLSMGRVREMVKNDGHED